METFSDDLVAKSSKSKLTMYYCENCDYNTDRKSSYDKHLLTAKHRKIHPGDKSDTKVAKVAEKLQIKEKEKDISCQNCGKPYASRNGLWKHSKVCAENKAMNAEITPELILDIIQQNQEFKQLLIKQNKENQELQKQILEVCKNGNNNTTNSNNTNHSHNKTFNLQFFLNEECKDALNISEFVSSIKVQLEDLETTGRLGYVEGVSRIINKNLNDLDQTKRPIHCSDAKREVLYIKNDDQWIKENETKPILTKAIRQIANENIKQISEWKKKYPDCTDSESRKNDLYLNIVSNAMSGCTVEEQTTNYEKIITKVAKEVVIEK
jgi:hypothetical protein